MLAFSRDYSCLYARTKQVHSIGIPRSRSTHSLPSCEDVNSRQQQSSNYELPRAVWSLAYKSDVLIVGCEKGSVEVSCFTIFYVSYLRLAQKMSIPFSFNDMFREFFSHFQVNNIFTEKSVNI